MISHYSLPLQQKNNQCKVCTLKITDSFLLHKINQDSLKSCTFVLAQTNSTSEISNLFKETDSDSESDQAEETSTEDEDVIEGSESAPQNGMATNMLFILNSEEMQNK